MPDLAQQVDILRQNAAPGNSGQISLVEDKASKFARAAYRYIGRDSTRVSALDRSTAPETLHMARTELVNAIQALYPSTNRERRRKALDSVTEQVLAITAAYTDMAITSLRCARVAPDNLYEPGRRGFPRAQAAPSSIGPRDPADTLYAVMV